MNVKIRADSVVIEGYVNAVERDSKPLFSRIGKFIERICKGAFKRAIERNDDIHVLLNHDWNRDLGSTKSGELELAEDNIGLKARATIKDKEVIEKARSGKLVGWSFGFEETDGGVITRMIDGILHRAVKDLNLFEVSILDNTKVPAYDGTLITARSEADKVHFRSEPFYDDVIVSEIETVEEAPEETQEETREAPEQQEAEKIIDYSQYNKIIEEMKED